jgi:hypothetical protein
MTQKKRAKTETIKERCVYIYLPSEEMVGRWKEHAEKAGVSLSKFVQEHVENSLAQELDETYTPRMELVKRVNALEGELSKVSEENRMLHALVDKLDEEVKGYRKAEFLEKDFEGMRRYDRRLVDLLKRRRRVESTELLGLLGIDPHDSSATRSVNKQLEALEEYGLVEAFPGGWRWRG